jgi:flagellar protein FliS
MLLDGAVRFAEMGRDGLVARDYEKVYNGVTRCQNILIELLSALKPEHDAELCARLSALYTFLITRLMSAVHERDLAVLDEVLGLLRYERETWAMLIERLAEARAKAGASAAPAAATTGGISVSG